MAKERTTLTKQEGVEDDMRELLERMKGGMDDVIREIEQQTAANDHNEAVRTLARFLGAKKHEKIMVALETIRMLEQSMPEELIAYRSSLRKELLGHAKRKLSQDDWKRLDAAF
jgi:hypothetical protein